jgi:probable selenium-dependent hydroxylase accessory protein YqeC
MSEEILDLLGAQSGLVCAIGAGGKKTTLYTLARHHPGRIAVTASVFVTHFPADLGAQIIVGPESAIKNDVLDAQASRRIAYACISDKKGRYAGVPPETIASIHKEGRFDTTFVKSDGARMRWLKAPKQGEPVIVPGCDTIIAVVSARAIGEVLSERIAHRLEVVEKVTGARRGEPFTATHLSHLLSRPAGLQKGTGSIRFVPVINMVDDDSREAGAREAAEIALASTDRFDRVILATMRRSDNPVVAVVER